MDRRDARLDAVALIAAVKYREPASFEQILAEVVDDPGRCRVVVLTLAATLAGIATRDVLVRAGADVVGSG